MTRSVCSDRKMFFVTLRKTLHKNGLLCALLTIFMTVLLNLGNIEEIVSRLYYEEENGIYGIEYCIGTVWTDQAAAAAMLLLFGVTALMLTLMNFRFMHTKKTVNVFYSLGMRRSTLFAGKYVGCVLTLLISIVVPFVTCFAMNCYLYGCHPALPRACLFYGLFLCAAALYPLAVCVLSMSLSGASVEGIVCGVLLTLAPSAVYGSLYLLSEMFLAGTAFNMAVFEKGTEELITFDFGGRGSFLHYLYPAFEERFCDAACLRTGKEVVQLSMIYPIFYLAVFAVLSVGARFAFVRKKTEKAGFLAATPALLAVVTGELSMLLITILLMLIFDSFVPTPLLGVVGLLLTGISFGLYIGLVALLLRSREKVKKQLRTAGVITGSLVVVLFVFFTGGFGFETRIPDTEDIVSAGITFSNGAGAVHSECIWYTYGGIDETLYVQQEEKGRQKNFLTQYLQSSTTVWGNQDYVSFEDRQAIEKIRYIHGLLLEKRENRRVYFYSDEEILLSYTLKNGAVLTRNYPVVSGEILEELQLLINKQEYRNACAGFLDQYKMELMPQRVCLFSKNLTSKTSLTVTGADEAFMEKLLAALQTEIRNGTLPTDMVSSKAPVGYIGLDRQYEVGVYYDKHHTDYLFVNEQYIMLPVYDTMQEVCELLAGKNLLAYFEDVRTPVRAMVYPCPFNDDSFRADHADSFLSYQFNGFIVDALFYGDYDASDLSTSRLPDGIFVQDADLLAQLCENTRYSYFVNKPGFFVELRYGDGDYTDALAYIPLDEMPEELR